MSEIPDLKIEPLICWLCGKSQQGDKRMWEVIPVIGTHTLDGVLCPDCYSPQAVEKVVEISLHERVLCAAIWVDTGEAVPARRSYRYPATGLLFCGWRHGDCFTTMMAWAEKLTVEERQRIGEEQLAGKHQGFLTSLGRYVDREDGMLVARTAGQTTCDRKKKHLFSEDLY